MNWRGLALIGGGIAIAGSLLIRKLDRDIQKADEAFDEALDNLRKVNRGLDDLNERLQDDIVEMSGEDEPLDETRERDDKTLDIDFGSER